MEFFSDKQWKKSTVQRTSLKLQEYATYFKSILKSRNWNVHRNSSRAKSPCIVPHLCTQIWPCLAQASKEHNIPLTRKALESRWFEEFRTTLEKWSFTPTQNEKTCCATQCPKTSRISYRDQKHFKIDNLESSLQILKNPNFLKTTMDEILLRYKQAQNVHNKLHTKSSIKPMIWAVSNNCWISTFPGRHNEQSHNAFYTAKTCRISYKHQEHYETDDGRCSEQFLKTRIFLWSTVHQLCYALNKYYGLSCLEATISLRFSYGLSCLEQLLKMDFSRDHKEQSQHVLYTHQTCRIRREHYTTTYKQHIYEQHTPRAL